MAVVAKVQKVVKDIADAPLQFANNLMLGVSGGFTLFFDNIAKHLLTGFLEWLLSGMKGEGISIEIPKEFSVKSVLLFFLQLLGISWARVRKLLVDELGEKPVMIMEKAAGVIYTLATKGLAGVFEDIQKMLDPKAIIDAIVDAAIKYLIETLIVKVAARIVLMLNPAGAILQALEAIYRVLKWIFTNAARIFRFVEAIVNGMADVIAGNTSGVAKVVEKALAMLIAPVIDFLADYLGLGGLPGKIATAVKGMQAWIESVLRSIVKWLVDLGKKLLAKLGIKGKDDKDKKGAGDIGQTLTFTEGKETHHLYIKVSGTNATVMVSSTPMTLSGWLDDLQNKKVPALTDKEQQKVATGLISTARSQLAATDKDADKAVQAKPAEAGAAAAPDLAPKINEEEEALRGTLDQLGKMFGQPMIVKSLKVAGPEKISGYSDPLLASIEGTPTGGDLHTVATGPEYVQGVLDNHKGKASFDAQSGTLTLPGVSASGLAGAGSTAAMGAQAATSTGVARVGFTKGKADFTLTGAIDEVKATLATGEAPPFKPIEKTATMSGGAEKIRIIDSSGQASLVESSGATVSDVLDTAIAKPFAGARNTSGPVLINSVSKTLLGPDKKVRATTLKGWLNGEDRKQLDEAADQTVTAATRIGADLDVASLKRITAAEKTTVDKVVFNMTVPTSVGSNTTYRTNFEAEVERQLRLQQDALNDLTLDAWVANIDTYKADQPAWISGLTEVARSAVLNEVVRRIDEAVATAKRASDDLLAAEKKAAKIKKKVLADTTYTFDKALHEITDSDYVVNKFTGRSGNEDEFREEHFDGIVAVLQKLYPQLQGLKSSSGLIKDAVLHNPDQIAGGFGMLPDLKKVPKPGPGEDVAAWDAYLAVIESYIGASKVNSRIGPGWAAQITAIYGTIKSRHKKEGAYPLWLLNFALSTNYKTS